MVAAADGRDALRSVDEHQARGTPFEAILLDMQMPVLDGYTTAAELRRRGFDKPIIALTANAMKDDEGRCLDCGCDHYLRKPLERATLVDAIAHYTQDVSFTELAARRAARQAAAPARRRKVLFVDDNADACRIAKEMLGRRGFEVATATNGAAALAVPGPFDAVVLDLGLPGMSGEELLANLKRRPDLEPCRFVCLSGRALGDRDWQALGFDDYLQKPARFEELGRLLESRGVRHGGQLAVRHPQIGEQRLQLRAADRLHEVMVEARSLRSLPVLLEPPARERDEHDVAAPGFLAQPAGRVEAVAVRHREIEQHHLGTELAAELREPARPSLAPRASWPRERSSRHMDL